MLTGGMYNDLSGSSIPVTVSLLTSLQPISLMETCKVRSCHATRQPLQDRPSGHAGGLATPWLAEEMLDGQHQGEDIPAHARTAHKGLLQKRLEEDL